MTRGWHPSWARKRNVKRSAFLKEATVNTLESHHATEGGLETVLMAKGGGKSDRPSQISTYTERTSCS